MRSVKEAQDIYEAGQSFLQASKLLCVIHVRPGLQRVLAKSLQEAKRGHEESSNPMADQTEDAFA